MKLAEFNEIEVFDNNGTKVDSLLYSNSLDFGRPIGKIGEVKQGEGVFSEQST